MTLLVKIKKSLRFAEHNSTYLGGVNSEKIQGKMLKKNIETICAGEEIKKNYRKTEFKGLLQIKDK